MTDRGWLRTIVGLSSCVWALAALMYFRNPLGTASRDPRLRVLGFTLFRSPSVAMEPTIHRNGSFLVSAWPYWHADPGPGDLVVFRYPLDPGVFFVKRIIASGGSTVEIREGVTLVDGRPVREPYVDPGNRRTPYSMTMASRRVPANGYFVMGDNRDDSDDSRAWGFISRSLIVGRVH